MAVRQRSRVPDSGGRSSLPAARLLHTWSTGADRPAVQGRRLHRQDRHHHGRPEHQSAATDQPGCTEPPADPERPGTHAAGERANTPPPDTHNAGPGDDQPDRLASVRRGPPGAGGRPPAGSSQSQGAQTAPPAAGAGHQAALGACRLECRVPQLPDRRLGTALQRADGRREGGRLHGGLGLGGRPALSAGDGETASADVSMAVRQPRADVVNGGPRRGSANLAAQLNSRGPP